MVWGAIKRSIGLGGQDSAAATLASSSGGPTRLPDYFPVEPSGCEKPSQLLFNCLANEATAKQRDLERVGFHHSQYDDIKTVEPVDPVAAQAVKDDPDNPAFPKPNDNPLDECKSFILSYQKCCDRALKRKKNWILTEAVRVQEEYRYRGPSKEEVPIVKSRGV